jgi:hypothetical protein
MNHGIEFVVWATAQIHLPTLQVHYSIIAQIHILRRRFIKRVTTFTYTAQIHLPYLGIHLLRHSFSYHSADSFTTAQAYL